MLLEFLCLLNVRIYFCLKSAKLWLEFRIKFNWYSMRSFQRAMVEFNNLRIYFTFRGFNRVSMSKISSPPIQMESWSSCLGGGIFSVSQEIVYSFKLFFDLFWNNIWPMYHSLDKRFTIIFFTIIGLRLSFTSQIVSHCVPDMNFFIIPSIILSQWELSMIELPKLILLAFFDSLKVVLVNMMKTQMKKDKQYFCLTNSRSKKDGVKPSQLFLMCCIWTWFHIWWCQQNWVLQVFLK